MNRWQAIRMILRRGTPTYMVWEAPADVVRAQVLEELKRREAGF